MKKIIVLSIIGLALAPFASANISVDAPPVSLVPDPILVKASSAPVALFSFTLSQTAGETLSSVKVLVANVASSTATTSDFSSLAVYRDNGDGTFNSGSDSVAGTQTSVNLSSNTTVNTTINNGLNQKFFVTLTTSNTWSGASPADSIKVTLPSDGLVTSDNSPTTSTVTTNTITADTVSPTLTSAIAKNTGGTSAKEAGDSVQLTFPETTNKPAINANNVNSIFALSSSHSWLDSDGHLGGAVWSVDGKILTLTLSTTTATTTSIPSVAIGDTVTISGTALTDLAGNAASGARIISGSFTNTNHDDDKDEDHEDEDNHQTKCGNSLINGRLYKVKTEATVYLAAACRLKPFRGAAVFHARGKKFQNIIELDSLNGITVSQKPVLPAGGTLIKGSDATVWFMTQDGHRRGFRTAAKFFALGFAFGQIKQISDQDLSVVPAGSPIEDNENHPDGALMKCGASPVVFQIIGGEKFPFRSAEAFTNHGHAWDSIAIIDCGRFLYVTGAPVD